MVIVLIHWKVKHDRVDEFHQHWRQKTVVHDRAGLIGEFLSEACHTSEFPWITWDLTGCEGKYRSFINVGIWRDAETFHEQVARYFPQSKPLDFEYEMRVRTVLRPDSWRIGDSHLPIDDSDGVL